MVVGMVGDVLNWLQPSVKFRQWFFFLTINPPSRWLQLVILLPFFITIYTNLLNRTVCTDKQHNHKASNKSNHSLIFSQDNDAFFVSSKNFQYTVFPQMSEKGQRGKGTTNHFNWYHNSYSWTLSYNVWTIKKRLKFCAYLCFVIRFCEISAFEHCQIIFNFFSVQIALAILIKNNSLWSISLTVHGPWSLFFMVWDYRDFPPFFEKWFSFFSPPVRSFVLCEASWDN